MRFELSEVRVRLDQATERIISRLKDRSRFPRNPSVYRPGGVPIDGRPGISLFDYALEGLEIYHGSLGRYAFPDQYPLLPELDHHSPVHRTIANAGLPRVEIPLKDALVALHFDTIERLCREGDDPGTFGETAYVDADFLHLLHERINVGRIVAAAKAASTPDIATIVPDTERLTILLRDSVREEALLDTVEATANRYELDPAIAREVFRRVIDQTLDLEVVYLQRLADQGQLATLLE